MANLFQVGIYTAKQDNIEWTILERNTIIGYINEKGDMMYFVNNISYWSEEMLRSIADLMNSIKIKYK